LAVKLASGGGDDADPVKAAQEKLDVNKKLTKMEVDTLNADASFVSVQGKLAESGAKLSAQLAEFQKSISSNSEWSAAKADLDKAKTDADTDEQAYQAALAKVAELTRERDNEVAAINRQRLEQSGGSKKR
jgi:hypothetical protein